MGCIEQLIPNKSTTISKALFAELPPTCKNKGCLANPLPIHHPLNLQKIETYSFSKINYKDKQSEDLVKR